MPKVKNVDLEEIRQAASGRWREILMAVGGCPDDILDEKNHPCPKCGGEDRFRMLSQDRGALFCNKCFNVANGDGFAAVGWLTGETDFGQVLRLVAKHLGIESPAPKLKPEEKLEFKAWSNQAIGAWLIAKRGIQSWAIEQCGGRLANYLNHAVVAFPVYNDLESTKPGGWVVYDLLGSDLPSGWDQKLKAWTSTTKVKLMAGSKPGLMGDVATLPGKPVQPEFEIEPNEITYWKVEGPTDMLALMTAIPEGQRHLHRVTCSGNGTEKPKWMAEKFADCKVIVVGDADQPGDAAAIRWASEIALHARESRHVRLPYEISENHGKDLRDFFVEGRTFDDLLRIVESASPVELSKDGGLTEEVELSSEMVICKDLNMQVLGEVAGSNGRRIKVFSGEHHKVIEITDVSRLTFGQLTQHLGKIVDRKVVETNDKIGTMHSLKQVRNAIHTIAGYHRIHKDSEVGVGVWPGRTEIESEIDLIIIAAGREAAQWNGAELERIRTPRSGGLLIDFGDSENSWCNLDVVENHLKSCQSPAWRTSVADELGDCLGQWTWRHQDIDPMLATGLTLATWVQTVWQYRPMVGVIGESNSGKSTLFELLGGQVEPGLFGDCRVNFSNKVSEPAIRQHIRNTGKVAILDEFEKSKNRSAVLGLLRTSTRGGKKPMGTSNQEGVSYGLRHICWIGSTELGLKEQADRNRFVILRLDCAPKGQHGNLKLPSISQRIDLGHRLLAVAIHSVIKASLLAETLKKYTRKDGKDVDTRITESLAVPAAMLSVACDLDVNHLMELFTDRLDDADEIENQQEECLRTVLDSTVLGLGGGEALSVAQILNKGYTERERYYEFLERDGVSVMTLNPKQGQPYMLPDDEIAIFIQPKLATRRLLRGTDLEGSDIRELLIRLPGARQSRRRVSGKRTVGVLVPWETIFPIDSSGQP